MTFGAVSYRPEFAGWNDVADVTRLSGFIAVLRPELWRPENLEMAPDLPAMAAMTEPAPVKTEPKPEPAKTEPEPVRTEPIAKTEPEPAVSKQPAIDNATVSSVVGTHRPEVLKCFAEGKKKDHGLKGVVALQMQVDAGGKVHHIQVQSTLKDPLVAACVVKSANNWKFPTRSGNGELATVSYPFTIN